MDSGPSDIGKKFSPSGLRQVLRSPLLWAIAAGFLFHFLRIRLPPLVLEALGAGIAPG